MTTGTQQSFITTAADRYEGGAVKAEIDIAQLSDIADEIARITERLQPMFERLDVARDVRACEHRFTRSRYLPDAVATVIAEALANELLGDEAAAVLMEMVKGEFE